MTNYAKLKNKTLIPAPREVEVEGRRIFNPEPEILRGLGYKVVLYPDAPADPPEVIEQVPIPMREAYKEVEDCIYVSFVPAEPEVAPNPANLREAAYRAEADQYLIAYEGYLVEGKTSEAEEQKTLYLAAKAKIRAEYPNIE